MEDTLKDTEEFCPTCHKRNFISPEEMLGQEAYFVVETSENSAKTYLGSGILYYSCLEGATFHYDNIPDELKSHYALYIGRVIITEKIPEPQNLEVHPGWWKRDPYYFNTMKLRYSFLVGILRGMLMQQQGYEYSTVFTTVDNILTDLVADTFNCGWATLRPTFEEMVAYDEELEDLFPVVRNNTDEILDETE